MTSNSETIPVGYKQAEVGVIPEDWVLKNIAQIAPLQRGFDLPSTKLKKGSFPVVYSNGIMNYHNKSMVKGPGVITGRSGTLGVIHYIEADFWPHNTTLWVTNFNNNFPIFVYYLYNFIGFRRFGSGSGVPTLNRNDAHDFLAAIPSHFTEQEAIANTLFDCDGAIQALEDLLSKKRDIKQGTMQELLTGKTRLPGFSGEWKSEKLKNIGMTFGGLTGKSKDDFGHGIARYITFMNIMTNVVIDCNALESVSVTKGETQNAVSLGDLFFNGSSETPEEVGMCSYLDEELHDVYLNSFCFGFRPNRNSKNDSQYLAYFFRSQEGRKLMASLAQGSTRYNISKTALLSVDFLIPELSEQQAIAEVLSDMDAEITALEQRLEKAKAIKQGMMQQLLTGRIRLVEPSTSVEASA